jgi:tetratricopeptide (TPR) repeat protein
MAGAVAAYTMVTELNPENGDAYLLIGRAQAACGKMAEAVAAYETAMQYGEEAAAKKQLSTLFLKKAQACAKAKDNKGTIENALKANEYLENANAYKLAASASQKMGNNAQCIEFYEKYLVAKPNAKDAAGVTFTIAALYQQMGNKDKAIEFYEKVATDPQFGAGAQEQLKVLK